MILKAGATGASEGRGPCGHGTQRWQMGGGRAKLLPEEVCMCADELMDGKGTSPAAEVGNQQDRKHLDSKMSMLLHQPWKEHQLTWTFCAGDSGVKATANIGNGESKKVDVSLSTDSGS